MDLHFPGSGYNQTVHSPHGQNCPPSATASSAEGAKALSFGMKTDKFSPAPDTLQLSPHLEPAKTENTRELPDRKRKISDHQYQSAFTPDTSKQIPTPADSPPESDVSVRHLGESLPAHQSDDIYHQQVQELWAILRASQSRARKSSAPKPHSIIRDMSPDTKMEATSPALLSSTASAKEQTKSTRATIEGSTEPLPDLKSAENEHGADSLHKLHKTPDARAAKAGTELLGSIDISAHKTSLAGKDSSDNTGLSTAGMTNSLTKSVLRPETREDSRQRSDSLSLSTSSSEEGVYIVNEADTEKSPGPLDSTRAPAEEKRHQSESDITQTIMHRTVDPEDYKVLHSAFKPLTLEEVPEADADSSQTVSEETDTARSLEKMVSELVSEDTDNVQPEEQESRQSSTTTGASGHTGLSATGTGSSAESEFRPKNEDDIQQISESVKKETASYRSTLTIYVTTVADPHLKPAKPPEIPGTEHSVDTQDTLVSTAQKKSVRWATSIEPDHSTSVHKETHKLPAEPLRTEEPAATSSPAESVIAAKKAATVGTPPESSDGLRTRTIKITYEKLGRHKDVYKQTFSPGTTLEVLQQRMNAQIRMFKRWGYKGQFPIRAEISSVIKGLPDSQKAFSFDEAGTRKAKLQGSAAKTDYEQEIASLFDKLKYAEAESDSTPV